MSACLLEYNTQQLMIRASCHACIGLRMIRDYDAPTARAGWLCAPRRSLEASILSVLDAPGMSDRIDFSRPAGDPGLLEPGCVGWRVMHNPATVFIGGVAAVLLEFLEPRVRAGVWGHSNFRTNPVLRLQRTGLAAMVTTYGSREAAEWVGTMTTRMHQRVRGTTEDGIPYDAMDPELQAWVFVTASFGFLQAYRRYLNPRLSRAEIDAYWNDLGRTSHLYGQFSTPASAAAVRRYMQDIRPGLSNSPVTREFIQIISSTPAYSKLALPVQKLLVSAAIDLLPGWARVMLGLEHGQNLRIAQRPAVRAVVLAAEWIVRDGPAYQACRRTGIPASSIRC